jgi:hypothetical protein
MNKHSLSAAGASRRDVAAGLPAAGLAQTGSNPLSSHSSQGAKTMGTITIKDGTEIGTEKRIHMRKISVFAAAAALILAGIGAWAASATQARVDIPVEGGLDPLQMMVNGPDLPTEHYVDHSLVFN